MYEGDAPLAERRAAALSLDRDLLNELLGTEELRELLDAGAIADVELSAQCIADGRRARSDDELHDVFRKVGDLSRLEAAMRCEPGLDGAVDRLLGEKRVIAVSIAGEERFVAAQDAALYRDALGCALPMGLPRDFTEPVARPLEIIVARYARTHAPFLVSAVVARYGVSGERVTGVLRALETDGRVVLGAFRPDGVEREWCDVEVLRQIRRRSLAALRREVEPVEQEVFARFLPAWHGIAGSDPAASGRLSGQRGGPDALADVIQMLQGAAIVASTLETDVLPQRIRGYRAADLDALFASGEVVWVGAGAIGSNDGRVRLFFADQVDDLLPAIERPESPVGGLHDAIRTVLAQRGASFWNGIVAATPGATDAERLGALWDLVWAGEITNDTFAPLRALLGGARGGAARRSQRPTSRPRSMRLTRVGPPAGSGRWSTIERPDVDQPIGTAELHAVAQQLLQRHGVLTREAVLAESVRGGFAGVYGVLKVLEERGHVRRGYFIDGLGAAQFALPGAVDRLRGFRDVVDVELHPDEALPPVVLASTDPAQPFGSVLAWPDNAGRPARSAASVVVVDAGVARAWFDTRSGNLVPLGASTAHSLRTVVVALAALGKDGRVRTVEVRKVNGQPISDYALRNELAEELRSAGFVEGYRGYVQR
jgi:ATP-dependent Lhr-like helicase